MNNNIKLEKCFLSKYNWICLKIYLEISKLLLKVRQAKVKIQKVLFPLLLLYLLLLSACNLIQDRTTVITQIEISKLHPTDLLPIASQIAKVTLLPSQQNLPYLLKKASLYKIKVILADDYKSLNGSESIQYTNNENTDLTEIYLQLFPNSFGPYLKIQRAAINDVVIQPVLEFKDTAARFYLEQPLKPDETLQLQLDYSLQVPTDFQFSYGLFVYADRILSLYQFIPLIPVFNEHGWQVSEPIIMGDLTFNDPSFFDVQVDAPGSLVIAASGKRISQNLENGRRNENYLAGPVRDFYLAGSPYYKISTVKWQDVTINSYAFKENQTGSDLVLATARHALEIFSNEFGSYPYTELDLVSAPMHNALGMEYSGIGALSIDLYESLAGTENRNNLEFTAAHEIAHQWFFNIIGSDQVDEPWLDEGMAQFATGLYIQQTHGNYVGNQYRLSWQQRWQRIQSQPIPIGLPVFAYTEEQYSPIIYGRAPLFIQSLMEKLGRNTFSDFLHTYYQKFQWGIVTTAAFRQTVEEICACSLESQFKDWVYPK